MGGNNQDGAGFATERNILKLNITSSNNGERFLFLQKQKQ